MPKFYLGMMVDDRVSVAFFPAANAIQKAVLRPGRQFCIKSEG
jgi:hypothetical protein